MHLHQGDGRSYLARHDTKYNLVWYVAPDSYAATNAASSGAFVLSESYLYTTQMIKTTLQHLTDDGIMVVQFGELKPRRRRTGRAATSSPRARRSRSSASATRTITSSSPRSSPVPATSRRSSSSARRSPGRGRPVPRWHREAARPAPVRGARPRPSATAS